ncbi:MbnP family protein [Flavobacterium sp. SM2513]|uniref:MbnP family protein n=1 Tax=Flavobacterium sp. SM2513 TaxID=3424766 RepID=UPI003D7F22F4
MHLKTYLLLALLFTFLGITAQTKADSLVVQVQLKFNQEDLRLNATYISAQKDTIAFDKIKFYLSDLVFIYKDNSQKKQLPTYHLIDSDAIESQNFSICYSKEKEIIGLKFNIGVDSLASVSGAMAGDLDATKGMYWAWQSGYINFKIEGKSTSCLTRKNKFHFHIGGYLKSYEALRTVTLKCSIKEQNKVNLILDLGKLFSEISLKETNTIMIPGKEAVKMADLLPNLFSIR